MNNAGLIALLREAASSMSTAANILEEQTDVIAGGDDDDDRRHTLHSIVMRLSRLSMQIQGVLIVLDDPS